MFSLNVQRPMMLKAQFWISPLKLREIKILRATYYYRWIAELFYHFMCWCIGLILYYIPLFHTVYPKKYAHGFVVLCFVVVMQSFIMNSYEVFIHIHQGCFAGTGAIVRLPQCQWSKPDGYGKISQCITTTKHSKAKTVCIFLGIYCSSVLKAPWQKH